MARGRGSDRRADRDRAPLVRPVRGAADPVGRDWLGILGLSVIGAAVAVLSFSALSDLATRFGVTGTLPAEWGLGWFRLAWLVPLAIDVFAVMATRAWLQGRGGDEAVAYARKAAWAAIWTSIVGNGAHGALVAAEQNRPLLWVLAAIAVGAVPAVALGALVHLVHLTLLGGHTRPRTDVDDDAEDEEVVPGETWEQKRDRLLLAGASRARLARELLITLDDAWELLRDFLLDTGAGRRRLSRELDISEYQARTLLDEHAAARVGGQTG